MKNQLKSTFSVAAGTLLGALGAVNVATISDQTGMAFLIPPAVGAAAGYLVRAKEDRRIAGTIAGVFLGAALSVLPLATVREIAIGENAGNVVSPFGLEFE